MAIRSDSYSSTAEVKAFTRHLLDGQTAFNSTTRPRLPELEKFIDRASGVLNVAIAQAGFSPQAVYANSTAKLLCDDFVTNYAVRYVELTQRGTGYGEGEGSRTAAFITDKAHEFIKMNSLGIVQLGITQGIKKSDGLIFTGMTAQGQRADKDDSTKEQPFARRHQFNDAAINNDHWHNSTGGA
jgi:hypothetical protein